MKKTIWWIIGIIIVVLVIISVSSGNKSSETGPIKIGFIGPLTGDAANVGQNAKAAVEVAVDEVNSAGGVNGRQIQVIYEDGHCGGNAINVANKLINIDKVSVILGGLCSGETMSFTKTANDSKMPVLSYCSSNPAITDAGDYIFRDYPSDNFQGKFAADYLYNTLGKKKVAILYSKNDWANGIKDVFMKEFSSLGGQIVIEEGFDQKSTDVRTSLLKVKTANPEAIYFLGYTNESIVALGQVKSASLNVSTWLGGDAWDDPKLWSTVGPSGEGKMYVVVSSMPNDSFKIAMQKKVGSNEILTCSAPAYDGLKLLTQVIGQVGSDPAAIKDALYKVKYTGGVSSDPIEFDQNGDLKSANYTINVVRNGVASPLEH